MDGTTTRKKPHCFNESKNNFGPAPTSKHVLRARRRHAYELSHILNMTKLPCNFNCQPREPWNSLGNRINPILLCGGDKHSFTVMPAVKANREKLLPKVAFKGVHQLRIQIHQQCSSWYARNAGWMKKVFFFPCLLFNTIHQHSLVFELLISYFKIILLLFPVYFVCIINLLNKIPSFNKD